MSEKLLKSFFLVFVSAVSDCVLISSFTSLVCVPVGIVSYEIGLKICAITAGNKKIYQEKNQLSRKR